MQLFDLSVKDYASIELWSEYLDFVLGDAVQDEDEDEEEMVDVGSVVTVDQARDIYNQALSSVGWHYTKVFFILAFLKVINLDISVQGYVIWSKIIDFELQVWKVKRMHSHSVTD